MRPGYPEFYRFEPNTRTVAVSPSAEFAVEYRINRVGMRDIDHTTYKKPGTTRIVFLGDSLTEGYGVELRQSYPYLIQSLSGGKFDCINAAMRGMSPADYAFRIQNVLDIYKDIDVLVLSLNGKDFYDDE
ncbi:MAG: SGNH/GDSL hydrolase family protein [bacterium]